MQLYVVFDGFMHACTHACGREEGRALLGNAEGTWGLRGSEWMTMIWSERPY